MGITDWGLGLQYVRVKWRQYCILYRAPQDVTQLRALAVDIVESFKSELDGRFSDENVELWQALQVLSPDHSQNDFLDFALLIPLIE